jgi:Domain of unknown function (DUF4234)
MPGEVRSTGSCIALYFCTLGIYSYVYNYKVHTEMKRYSGRGIGGGVALLLTFVANVAMPFVTPAEVGSMYSMRGQQPPVRGWTGLWFLLSVVGGYLVFIVGLIAGTVVSGSNTSNDGSHVGSDIGIAVVIVLFAAMVIGGGITWFVKTNGALNRFWESAGV